MGKTLELDMSNRRKRCGKCKEMVKLALFRKAPIQPGRRQPEEDESGYYLSWCRMCENIRAKAYQAARYVHKKPQKANG
jgi:hypothetical protein